MLLLAMVVSVTVRPELIVNQSSKEVKIPGYPVN